MTAQSQGPQLAYVGPSDVSKLRAADIIANLNLLKARTLSKSENLQPTPPQEKIQKLIQGWPSLSYSDHPLVAANTSWQQAER